jgi:hypothetical protein
LSQNNVIVSPALKPSAVIAIRCPGTTTEGDAVIDAPTMAGPACTDSGAERPVNINIDATAARDAPHRPIFEYDLYITFTLT